MDEEKNQEGVKKEEMKVEDKKESEEPVKPKAPVIHHIPRKEEDQPTLTGKMKDNPWILSTLVLGIVALILITGTFSGGMTGNAISGKAVSPEVAGNAILELANSQVGGAELVEVNEQSGLYEVILLLEGREVPVYVTIDGENLVAGGITPLSVIMEQSPDASPESRPVEVTKSDKPVVELFVMTHCPYGTQAEKGILSTIGALGDDIDATIRFVHYFMHDPEETETPRQVCIREEQSDKWYAYLECFLEDGDSDRCLTETGVDKTKMESCISSGKADEYYAADAALSESYGVQGSPTLVINGVQANSGRDSASYLAGICAAFNEVPGACSEGLSSVAPSPGFGWEGTSAGTTATC